MFKLGITGGLGSGKSEAARFFSKRGAVVFDADIEAKNHLHRAKSLHKKLVRDLGDGITDHAGNLDFKRLASIAFAHEEKQQILNQIIWPEVKILIKKAAITAEADNTQIFIVDAALMLEAKHGHLYDAILLIACEDKIKIQRALKRGNLSEEQIMRRLKLQMKDVDKRLLVDYIIENNGSIQFLQEQLSRVHSKILKRITDQRTAVK